MIIVILIHKYEIIDNPIPKLVLEESAGIIKSPSTAQNTNTSSDMIAQG